jgi:hypothetical protein
MPKIKPVTRSDFEQVTKLLGHFLLRLGATVVQLERASRQAQRVNAAANGAKGSRRRRHSPIDRAAVIKAMGKAGKKGLAAGQIAERMRVEVSRLRPVLWQLRDDGQLHMTGKLALARYQLASSSPNRPAKGGSAKRAQTKARARRLSPQKSGRRKAPR